MKCYNILIVLLFFVCANPSVAAPSKHQMCPDSKRVDARKALGKAIQHRDPKQQCIGKYIHNHNVMRLPEVIPEIVCPSGTGDQCIQIVLPMNVSFVQPGSGRRGKKLVSKIVYVQSGCIDNRTPVQTKYNSASKAIPKRSRRSH